jgi:CRP-like cAMP-binding protein/class 3 adenylate cyclase
VPARPAISERVLDWFRRSSQPDTANTPLRQDHGDAQPCQREPAAGFRPPAVSFWDALDPAEREALAAVAVGQVFAAGEILMREGDLADHVMVIIEGHAEVCVDENGWERVLAERGPGELVGERGGLQLRVRSASVIALDTVRVLTVRTGDFHAFVNGHPKVFDIVEQQLYDRLTEAPAGHQDGFRPRDASATPGITRPTIIRPVHRPVTGGAIPSLPPLNGENCAIVYSDVVGFSSADRNDADRLAIRMALFGITRRILLDIPGAWSQDRGDGLLTVIPPNVPTADVMALLHKGLPSALDRHNRTDRRATRFQLRIAVDVGPVTSDTMGVSGEAIIIAARLLEAAAFKAAFAGSTANLGVIASQFVFEAVIRHSPNPLDLAGYSQVPVEVKGLTTLAWMRLFNAPEPPIAFYRSAAPDSLGAPLGAPRRSGSMRARVSRRLGSEVASRAARRVSHRSWAFAFSGRIASGVRVAMKNRTSACSCAGSPLPGGTLTIATCLISPSGQGTRSGRPVSSSASRATMASGSVSPGSPWPPTCSQACWRWCQRSSTRPLGGCAISADAVTCSGRSRRYGSPTAASSARTRCTSAVSASPSGW